MNLLKYSEEADENERVELFVLIVVVKFVTLLLKVVDTVFNTGVIVVESNEVTAVGADRV